jgi:hypothetical protein
VIINPHIRPDEVIVQTSRETFVVSEHDLPPGAVIVARGPDRIVLWAELCALWNVAALIIREQS